MNEKAYEEIGRNYRFFLAWRHAAFAGGLAILWGAAYLFSSAYEKGLLIAVLIPGVASLAEICLWFADRRTRDEYRSQVEAGEALEGSDPGPYHALKGISIPVDAPFWPRKGRRFCKLFSQSFALDCVFLGSAAVFLVVTLVVLSEGAVRLAGESINWAAIGAVGQWVAGIGTLLVLIYAIHGDYWKRPKLLLDFSNDRDVKSQSNTVGLDPSSLSRWLRVRVRSAKSRKAAKNCRAFLVGIEKLGPGGRAQDVFPNDVRPLMWMHDPPGQALARDLLPGVVHWVDIVSAIDGSDALRLQVQPACSLNEPGDYVLAVQVSAKDAEPAVIKLQIRWNGVWSSLSGQQI